MLQSFRDKTEGILELVGSVSEKVKEEEKTNFHGESFTKRVVNMSWTLKDPQFGSDMLAGEAEDQFDSAAVDRMINKFYSQKFKENTGRTNILKKINNL